MDFVQIFLCVFGFNLAIDLRDLYKGDDVLHLSIQTCLSPSPRVIFIRRILPVPAGTIRRSALGGLTVNPRLSSAFIANMVWGVLGPLVTTAVLHLASLPKYLFLNGT